MSVLILDEAQLRACVRIDASTLDQVETAFTWLAEDRVSMPPVMHIEVDHQSDVDIKGAYVRGLDAFAVKIASGFFGNFTHGLPNASGMVVLLSAKTGFCECVFLDNGYLTDLRTGLAGAVAGKHLAPKRVDTVGVIGAGAQARYQVESLCLVRDFERVLVAGRIRQRVQDYCDEMTQRLGIEVAPAASREELVRESQLVVTTTQAKESLIEAAWVHQGLHITAMGSDLPGKREIDPQILAMADKVVCDSHPQCVIGGELQHAETAGLDISVTELGAITSGRVKGRERDEQITVCDLTGTGVQDTAIALQAYRQAVAQDMGIRVSEL